MKRIFTVLLGLTSLIAVAQQGSLDTSFDPGTGGDNIIGRLAIQSDGKIIIVGTFTSYNGTLRNRVARLNQDGTIDTSFDPGVGANDLIDICVIQPDGKIVIVGAFTSYNGIARNRIARINSDGTLDTSFNPGTGANGQIYAVALQSDGKIIIGGPFTSYNGTSRVRLARVNTDGSLDTSFDPGTGANNWVRNILIQQDGQIMIIGAFTSYNGTVRNRIARINTNGTIDLSFDPGAGANGTVYSITTYNNGDFIVGGAFTSFNNTLTNRLCRISSDGTFDPNFNVGLGANNDVYPTIIHCNNKIIVAGNFTTFNGVSRVRIARLNANGSLDTFFDPGTGANAAIYGMNFLPNGNIIIVGPFTSYNGIARNRIAVVKGEYFNSSSTISPVACYSYTENGQTYTSTGTYVQIIPNSVGCDSTITINLTIDTVNTNVTVAQSVLTADATGATYQWIDCDNITNPHLPGETNQSFTATVNGNYAVIVTENNCTDTSDCFEISTIGIKEVKANNLFSFYPNPVKDYITIASTLGFDNTVIKVIALTGQTIHEERVSSVKEHTINLSTYASGIYFIEVNQNGKLNRMKAIKN